MGQETMGKKEREKKKRQKKKEKAERRLERKENNNKGKDLDDMMVYLDENGNLSDTPPDPNNKVEISAEDIQLGAAPTDPRELIRKGVVTYFNHDKGYGFINDLKTQQSTFFHINETSEPIGERDKVNFEVEKGPKGLVAVRVVKIK